MADSLDEKLSKVLGDLRTDLDAYERPEEFRDAGVSKTFFGIPIPEDVALRERVRHHRQLLADENPDALWPDGFDEALIGLARRCGQPTLAAFSVKKAIDVLMKRDGTSFDDAVEFFEFNVSGAWVGPGTPIWVDDLEE